MLDSKLDSEAEAIARQERPRAVLGPQAGDEWPDVALGLHLPGQAPQRVARLDDVVHGRDGPGVREPLPPVGRILPGAGEGAGTEQEGEGGEAGKGQGRPPPEGRHRGRVAVLRKGW